MPGCAAIGCNNRSEKGYTMKCFPRDPALRNIWKQRVGRADWEPSNNSFLCHVHFEPNQWVVTPSGRVKLKKGALPSIFTVTSTRKSPKKRQKLGVPTTEEDDDLEEEYEVEYLENECPFIFNMSDQKVVPNVINVQTQNTTINNGQILQNIKFISSEALKDLQNENIIIVADENNREIGKIINDNGFVLVGNERGKENVEVSPKPDKLTPAEIKIEIKEEAQENGLSAHDYDEIERKLQEICHSENEGENTSSKESPKKGNNQSIETESIFSLEDLDNGSDNVRENTGNQEPDPDVPTIRTGTKRKRKIKLESQNLEKNVSKSSQSLGKVNETQFTEDINDIINDLETETPVEGSTQQSKYVTSITSVKNSQSIGTSKPTVKNDIQLKFKNNFINKPTQNKRNNIQKASNLKPDELTSKLNVQGEVIEKLTNQLIMYKDMDRKIHSLTQELQNKNKEIEMLTQKVAAKKTQVERRSYRNESVDLKDASEAELRNRIDFLEDNNKKLMKTVTLEGQNRRKLECQVKSRDNQIKELNWKLEKASKFLDRAEKNANNYRKKMLNMQALIRRKKLLNDKSSTFDELLVCQTSQNFSENALKIALEIEKVCGIEGYQKLLSYEFPLPNLKILSTKYPSEIDYYEPDEEENFVGNKEISDNANERQLLDSDIKMENVEYLESEFLSEPDETVTGTVQDIFNESSDSEDLNLNELKKHIMIDLGVTA